MAVAGTAVLGGAAVAAGIKMVGMASDAAEVQSKLKVTFGDALPALTKNLDTFAAATGGSRFEMRQQAADMGALLAPMLGSQKGAADMSAQFTKLAADLGSFNNIPTGEALEKIRAGLVGESEPLRSLGVLLTEATVKTEAYRSGIAKQGAELTEAQKVQARANLIMKQTALAQGDAERTSGSMANQMKALKNAVSDTGTELGMKLIPAALAVATHVNDLIPKLSEWGSAMSEKIGPAITAVVGAVRDNLPAVREIFEGVFGWIRDNVVPVFVKVGEIAGAAFANIVAVLRQHEPELRTIFGGIKTLLEGAFKVIETVILPIVRTLFVDVLPPLIGGAIIVIAGIVTAIGKLKTAVVAVADFLSGGFTTATGAAKTALNALAPVLTLAESGFDLARSAARAIATLFEGPFTLAVGVGKAAIVALDKAVDGVRAAFNLAKSAGATLAEWLAGAWDTAVSAAKLVTSGFDKALDGVRAAIAAIKTAGEKLGEFFSGTWEKFWSAASTALAPLSTALAGISGALGAIESAAGRAADAIRAIPTPGDLARKLIPGYQHGGTVRRAGLALVGEAGPELLALPAGARVFNAAQTGRMFSAAATGGPMAAGAGAGAMTGGGGGGGNTFVFNFPHYVGNERDLAHLVRDQFNEQLRANPRLFATP